MKKTNKYGLTYFEKGDFTSSLPEMQRWETLDNQLFALFNVLGNGVISGWDLLVSSELTVIVSPGSGHVAFAAVESTNSITLNLTPNTVHYVYAILTVDSYWTKNVTFITSLFENTNSDVLLLGIVTTNDNEIITDGINIDGKKQLGFIELVNNAVKNHRHIGGTTNPNQINLATDVQGEISQENLPSLDASVIQTGTIDVNRLPLISHIDNLSDQGSLTHPQLDSFINSLSMPDQSTMGEISTINLLQLILSLKHIYPEIDDYLVNEIAIIPGISPDSYIDLVNTTANVDLRTHAEGGTHKITGASSTGFEAYVKIWDSEKDFKSGTYSNVLISGDSVSLSTKENIFVIDDFVDVLTWTVETKDLSSVPAFLLLDPPNGANLNVGSENVQIILQIKKTFSAQDWSNYDYLKLFIKTESVEHGDLYFYLIDNYSGIQNSYTNVLPKNSPSINIDTLENGWQEVTINLTNFNRTAINEIGFYVGTQGGWDTSKGFNLNFNNFYLSSGNVYENDGHLYLTYGSDFLYRFWRVRWEDVIPSDILSSGVSLVVRTRVANTEAGLELAAWTDYYSVSGYEIPIPVGEMYKYLQLDFYFTASTSLKRSVVLKKAYLDFYASDIDNSFEYNKKEDWDGGEKYNIDTNSVADAMTIYGNNNIGDIIYGTNKNVFQLNDSLVQKYKIYGTMFPRSTYQILNDISSGLGTITAVTSGNMGSLWICDTDNDRVVEIDPAGNVLRGFFGSYLVENTDNVTNASSQTTTLDTSNVTNVSSQTTTLDMSNVTLLQSLYNKNNGFLYMIFDRDLSDTEVLSIQHKFVKVGASNFYLDNFGCTKAMKGFDHVVKIKIDGSDKTLLDYIVSQAVPSISILNPYQYEQTEPNVTFNFVVFNFVIGNGVGENGIRLTIDGVTTQDIYSTSFTTYGLLDGVHTVKAQLLNADDSLNTNIEAIAESTFVVQNATYALPYISVLSPIANQIYASSPIQIEFKVDNFPILPNGQHLKYSVDGDIGIDYYSTDPILIDGLSNGKHTVSIYLVDVNGDEIVYTYGNATINFIVGNNSNYAPKIYVNAGNKLINCDILISNLIFSDMYAPFDVQYIPFEISPLNPSGKESILIAKLTNNYILQKNGMK